MTLREVRLYRGLSQGATAKLSGLSQQFVSKLELGHLKDMNLHNGIKLAKALRVKPETLDKILSCTRLTHGIGYSHEGQACLTRNSTLIAAELVRSSGANASSTTSASMTAVSSQLGDDSGPSSAAPPTEDLPTV